MKKPPESYWVLFKIAQERMRPLLENLSDRNPDLLNSVFGLPEPNPSHKRQAPSVNEQYWLDWFYRFSEIDRSLNRLDQTLVYLSHYTDSRALRFHGLSEADWVRYHIEAYFQEMYILSERLRRFLREAEKVVIGTRDEVGLSSVTKLKTVLESSFKMVVSTRGKHVHEYRFQSDELRDLDTLVLLTKAGGCVSFAGFAKSNTSRHCSNGANSCRKTTKRPGICVWRSWRKQRNSSLATSQSAAQFVWVRHVQAAMDLTSIPAHLALLHPPLSSHLFS